MVGVRPAVRKFTFYWPDIARRDKIIDTNHKTTCAAPSLQFCSKNVNNTMFFLEPFFLRVDEIPDEDELVEVLDRHEVHTARPRVALTDRCKRQ